ncbi:MAG: hypothetical protein ACXWDN_01380 [Limisphaerales bacterium]
MKTLIFTITLFLVAAFDGLAQTNAAVPHAGSAPINLAKLIASADHIIATNRFDHSDARYRDFSLTISGDQARKIVSAVSTARLVCSPPCSDSMFDWDLKFYREAHFLTVVHVQRSRFMLGDWKKGAEYVDSSGVLERLYRDLLKRAYSEF